MRFKTCKKLCFDCTLNKLYFNVMFKSILLFLIISSSSHRNPSVFQQKPAWVGGQLRIQFMFLVKTHPQTYFSANKRQSRHDAEPQQEENHLEELLSGGVEFMWEDF